MRARTRALAVALPIFGAAACGGGSPSFDAADPVGTYEWSGTGTEGEPLVGVLRVTRESGALHATMTSPSLAPIELPVVRAREDRLLLRGGEDEESFQVTLEFEGGKFTGHWAFMGVRGPVSGRMVSRSPHAAGPGGEERVELASMAGLHDLLLQRFRSGAFSGAVLVTQGDSVLFSRQYGMTDPQTARPIRQDTRFDIGSLTKLLVSVSVLRLAQDGRIDLDAPVTEYLPGLAADVPGADAVTPRHLLQHRGGFGDHLGDPAFRAEPARFRGVPEYMALIRGKPLAFAPGTMRAYSNDGFVVLGAVLESVVGREWHETVGELVIEPAQMVATGPRRSEASAAGQTRESGRSEVTSGRWPPVASPAGGMHATAEDLERLVRALLADRLLEARWTDVLLRDFQGPGGDPVDRGGRWDVAWEGGAAGLNAHLGYDALRGRAVVVLANMDPPAASAVGRATLREGR